VKQVQPVCQDSPDETVFQVFREPKVPKVSGVNRVATVPLVHPGLTVNQVFQAWLAPTVFQAEPVCQVKARLPSLTPKFCWLLPKVHPVDKVCPENEVNVVLEANRVQPVFEVKTAAMVCQVFSVKMVLQV